jgi:hypothetical protein
MSLKIAINNLLVHIGLGANVIYNLQKDFKLSLGAFHYINDIGQSYGNQQHCHAWILSITYYSNCTILQFHKRKMKLFQSHLDSLGYKMLKHVK